jgi:hypothetical protein
MKKKTVTIIVAICALVTAVVTNIYYFTDDDPNTNPDIKQVVEKVNDLKDAIKE